MGIIERALYFLLRVFSNTWTPTFTDLYGMTMSPPVVGYADYAFIGKELVWINLQFTTTIGGTPGAAFSLSLPFECVNAWTPVPCNFFYGGSTSAGNAWVVTTGATGAIRVKRADEAAFASGSYMFSFSGIIRRTF